MSGDSSPKGQSCDRWLAVEATDSLDGVDGIVDHYARTVVIPTGESTEVVFRDLEERLLRYDIFPRSIMRADVCSDDGRIHEGTVLVQHVSVGPIPIEAAVRVIRVWRTQEEDAEEVGFTYATLKGHPERGVSSFYIRRSTMPDQIAFLVDARSRPGSLLTRLTRPIARRFQRRATQAALTFFTARPDSASEPDSLLGGPVR